MPRVKKLIDKATSSCEEETLCMATSDAMIEGLTRVDTAPEIPTDEVPVIQYKVVFRAKDPKTNFTTIIGHGFVVAKDEGEYYLLDSWEGMHPIAVRKIPIEWFASLKSLVNELESGKVRTQSFKNVFGTWEKEQEKLRAKGEYVNEYSDDKDYPNPVVKITRNGFLF